MKLVKFRVKNYKSVADSGDCYTSKDGVTIFAGRNESGKTTILEALASFDVDQPIADTAKHVSQEKPDPSISVVFEVPTSELIKIFEDLGEEWPTDIEGETLQIEIIKDYPHTYRLGKATLTELGLDYEDDTEEKAQVTRLNEALRKYTTKYPQLGGNLTEINFKDIVKSKQEAQAFKIATDQNASVITEDDDKEQFLKFQNEYVERIESFTNWEKTSEGLLNTLKEMIPNFILFSSFNDIFPNTVKKEDLDKSEWIRDLSVISNLDVEKIRSGNKQIRSKHKMDLNLEINEQYKRFWTQDEINIEVEYDNEELLFWICESGIPYTPEQRSKGQQWHMAFYIKVSARAKENVSNIILIDEPGLYLHAKAQKDVLNKLGDIAKDVQVFFSTHSSYLLESENFYRIKLVIKEDSDGTKLYNKIHAFADKETLTPILTAIGLEINSGIENIEKVNNVVVEGPSDVYYLIAFKKLLKGNRGLSYDFNFIFGGGNGKMPMVGTILHGWGCKVLYLYDNDSGYTEGKRNLKRNWFIEDGVEKISGEKGSIEDLFSKKDFKKYILKEESVVYSGSNSEYIANNSLEKVIPAKLFLEEVNGNPDAITLTKTTLDNFEKLFSKIKPFFEDEN